jgi:hypothetical protein
MHFFCPVGGLQGEPEIKQEVIGWTTSLLLALV